MQGPFYFGFPGQEPSAEDLARMKEAQDRREMEISAFQHDFQRLFEELPEEQLRVIRTMMQLVECEHNINAAKWEAMIAWAMKVRFGTCVTCGVNHDTELHVPEHEPESGSDHVQVLVGEVLIEEAAKAVDPEADDLFGFTDTQRGQMAEYHLDDVYDEDTGKLLYFACTGIEGMKGPCGVTYPSIEDRMLKPPESCSGCFQRMMHG